MFDFVLFGVWVKGVDGLGFWLRVWAIGFGGLLGSRVHGAAPNP